MTARLEFWFDFASTYSYLSIQRVAAAAGAADLAWRPFLLGPIFAAQGWSTSPFLVYPAKGAFMFRDMARRAETLGLPFRPGGKLPVNSVAAARLATAALADDPDGAGPEFCRRVSFAHWGEGREIDAPEVLADCARAAGFDPRALLARSEAPEIRPLLRARTEQARRLGIFGAPSFTTAGPDGRAELFWGDDQLEDALAWAATGRMAPRQAALRPCAGP